MRPQLGSLVRIKTSNKIGIITKPSFKSRVIPHAWICDVFVIRSGIVRRYNTRNLEVIQ